MVKWMVMVKLPDTSSGELEVKQRLEAILAEVPFARVRRWVRGADARGTRPDLVLDLRAGGESWRRAVEVKRSGEPRILRGAIQQLQAFLGTRPRQYAVVAAPYLGPAAQAVCREANVGYLDLAGNCRLVFDRVFIERRGFPNPRVERRPLRSIFATRASQVLRVLLEAPGRAWQVQQLAREAQVSLGLAFKVKRRLLDLEYARDTGEGIQLAKAEDLVRDWGAAGLPRTRRQLDCYAPGEPADVEASLGESCRRRGVRFAWTSFSGAARVAPFTRYTRSAAYVDADLAATANALGWKAVPTGANVTLLAPPDQGVWYGLRPVGEDPVVSDVQLYLDLVGSKGRGEEAATFILEQRLRPKW
jgi:hypothetical protein